MVWWYISYTVLYSICMLAGGLMQTSNSFLNLNISIKVKGFRGRLSTEQTTTAQEKLAEFKEILKVI